MPERCQHTLAQHLEKAFLCSGSWREIINRKGSERTDGSPVFCDDGESEDYEC